VKRLLLISVLALAMLCILSLCFGASWWTPDRLLATLRSQGDPLDQIILFDIRLPRMMMAALIGAMLALSGAALQGLLHNPLAEPGVTGVSASASLGAVLMIYTGLAATTPLLVPLAALFFAALALLLVMLLTRRRASSTAVILAGAAISSLCGALLALVMNLARTPYLISDITSWLMGSVANRGLDDVLLLLPFVMVGGALLLASGRSLDKLALGEETAQTLGVPLSRVQAMVLIGSAIGTGACVAASGAIGFVGLVVPHLLRPFTGGLPSRLLLPSALYGAAFLMLADLAVRLWPGAQELKIGVVTALIGAPLFIARILSLKNEEA
jgi:iron complex transport system permease protein